MGVGWSQILNEISSLLLSQLHLRDLASADAKTSKERVRMGRQRVTPSPLPGDAGRLKEEIAILERRLAQIGPDGDCRYEKALIRFFEQQLGERRAQLQGAGQPLAGG